jgi:AraC-like DNA-binding protein
LWRFLNFTRRNAPVHAAGQELQLEVQSSDKKPASTGPGYSVRRFTTDSLPERQRLASWREEFGRTIVRTDIEPLTDEAIQAEATLGELLEFRWLDFRGTQMRFHRTRSMAASGDDYIGLIINRDKASTLSHRNRDLTLDNGDACAVLTFEPGMIANRRHLGLLFPRALLASRLKNITDLVANRIAADTDALRLLIGYFNALPQELAMQSARLQRTVVDHIYDLTALAICPDRPADENSLSATAAARLKLALAYLDKHFDFPGLTISAVASDQNISSRYLQRLIETTGSTFSERLGELRLQRALNLLADARQSRKRIAEIALRSGFSDVSYFNRVFRKRFGETPRTVRGRVTNVAHD